MSKKICFIGMSGGLDSFITGKYLGHCGFEVIPVYFDYGSTQSKEELKVIKSYDKLIVTKINIPIPETYKNMYPLLGKEGKGSDFIPGRNAIFISNLLCLCEASRNISSGSGRGDNDSIYAIALGVTASGHANFPDTRTSFVDAARMLVYQSSEGRVEFIAPFESTERWENIKFANNILRISEEELAKTYSCYSGNEIHCGECHACRSRKKGFEESGVTDLTVYSNKKK